MVSRGRRGLKQGERGGFSHQSVLSFRIFWASLDEYFRFPLASRFHNLSMFSMAASFAFSVQGFTTAASHSKTFVAPPFGNGPAIQSTRRPQHFSHPRPRRLGYPTSFFYLPPCPPLSISPFSSLPLVLLPSSLLSCSRTALDLLLSAPLVPYRSGRPIVLLRTS